MTVVLVGASVGCVLLGFLAGMLTFKRSLNWCPTDGSILTCPVCGKWPRADKVLSGRPAYHNERRM